MGMELRGTTKDQFAIVSRSGLTIKVLGGRVMLNNVSKWVEPVTLVLADDTTNYVYINMLGVIVGSTSPTPMDGFDLWKIVTASGEITSVEDQRAVPRMSEHTKFQTDPNWLATGAFNADTGWTDLNLSAVAPPGASGVVVGLAVSDSGVPSPTVWTGLRKPGETEVPRQSRLYPQVSGIYSVVTAIVGLDATKKIQYRVVPSGTSTVYLRLVGWIFGG